MNLSDFKFLAFDTKRTYTALLKNPADQIVHVLIQLLQFLGRNFPNDLTTCLIRHDNCDLLIIGTIGRKIDADVRVGKVVVDVADHFFDLFIAGW